MTFRTIRGSGDCITQQDYERDRYGNVSGGVPRVIMKSMRVDEAAVYPARYEWIETVPMPKEESP